MTGNTPGAALCRSPTISLHNDTKILRHKSCDQEVPAILLMFQGVVDIYSR